MTLETDKVGSISTWAAEADPGQHATEHNALHAFYNALFAGAVDAEFTVGAEAADNINVAVQLVDAEGDAVAERHVLTVYISDDAEGDALATAPDEDVVIGTDGVILTEHVTDVLFTIITDATGAFDLDIGEGDPSTNTFYVVVVMPNGTTAVSGAATFADDS